MDDKRERVEYLLRNKDKLQEEFKKREVTLLNDIESEQEAIEALQLKTKTIKEFVPGKTNKPQDPMFDILTDLANYKQLKCIEIAEGLVELRKEQSGLEMVMRAYDKLEVQHRDIMQYIYFNNLTWLEVAHKMGLSERTCQRKRRKGIKTLLKYLNDMEQGMFQEG